MLPNFFNNVGGNPDEFAYSDVKYPYFVQLRLYFYDLTKDLFGIHSAPLPNPYFEYFIIFCIISLLLIIPFIFVFRNEKFIEKTKLYFRSRFVNLKKIKELNISFIIYIITAIVIVFIVSYLSSAYKMGVYRNRYLFVVYPIASVGVICLFYYILKFFINNKKIISSVLICLSIILAIWSHSYSYSWDYLFLNENEGFTSDDIEDNSRCILIFTNDWHIVCFAPDLYHIDSYFATSILDYDKYNYFEDFNGDLNYYMFVSTNYLLKKGFDDSKIEENYILNNRKNILVKEEDLLDYFKNFKEVKDVEFVGIQYKMKEEYRVYHIILN